MSSLNDLANKNSHNGRVMKNGIKTFNAHTASYSIYICINYLDADDLSNHIQRPAKEYFDSKNFFRD